VVCIARDDGCATIPIGAFEQIRTAMKPDDKIELTVRRYVSTVESLETTTAVQIKASTRVDLELTQN